MIQKLALISLALVATIASAEALKQAEMPVNYNLMKMRMKNGKPEVRRSWSADELTKADVFKNMNSSRCARQMYQWIQSRVNLKTNPRLGTWMSKANEIGQQVRVEVSEMKVSPKARKLIKDAKPQLRIDFLIGSQDPSFLVASDVVEGKDRCDLAKNLMKKDLLISDARLKKMVEVVEDVTPKAEEKEYPLFDDEPEADGVREGN